MAKYGSNALAFSMTTASSTATAWRDLSNYIDTVNGHKIEALVAETHGFGDSWQETLFTGVKKMDDITLGGFFDDVATSGPHALLGQSSDPGAERRAKFDFASPTSELAQFACIVVSYARMPTRNELTRFEAVLRPSGAVNTATGTIV